MPSTPRFKVPNAKKKAKKVKTHTQNRRRDKNTAVGVKKVTVVTKQVLERGTTDLLNKGTPHVTLTNKKMRFLPYKIMDIMKMDSQAIPSEESVFLIGKATELFVQILARHAYTLTTKNKKKVLRKVDVVSAVSENECYVFLNGYF
uniref:Transcription factor CBF/NF-Y/archaeal histone domain-containing protein n=1 Tax=Graphocephala atropunctata TaxID=36148 RepID=A0A1B6M248_9HEMI